MKKRMVSRRMALPGPGFGRMAREARRSMLRHVCFLVYALVFGGAFSAQGADSKALTECKSISAWNAFHAHAAKANSAEGLESFDAKVDLVSKDVPQCLIDAFPTLTPATREAVLRRVSAQAQGSQCKEGYHPDLDDSDWCPPALRDKKENCFDKSGNPFYWCKNAPSLLRKLKNSDISNAAPH